VAQTKFQEQLDTYRESEGILLGDCKWSEEGIQNKTRIWSL